MWRACVYVCIFNASFRDFQGSKGVCECGCERVSVVCVCVCVCMYVTKWLIHSFNNLQGSRGGGGGV